MTADNTKPVKALWIRLPLTFVDMLREVSRKEPEQALGDAIGLYLIAQQFAHDTDIMMQLYHDPLLEPEEPTALEIFKPRTVPKYEGKSPIPKKPPAPRPPDDYQLVKLESVAWKNYTERNGNQPLPMQEVNAALQMYVKIGYQLRGGGKNLVAGKRHRKQT